MPKPYHRSCLHYTACDATMKYQYFIRGRVVFDYYLRILTPCLFNFRRDFLFIYNFLLMNAFSSSQHLPYRNLNAVVRTMINGWLKINIKLMKAIIYELIFCILSFVLTLNDKVPYMHCIDFTLINSIMFRYIISLFLC